MNYIMATIIVGLILGASLIYVYGQFLDGILDWGETAFPSVFTGAGYNFMKSLRNWMGFILVVLPLMIWVYYNSQRPEQRI